MNNPLIRESKIREYVRICHPRESLVPRKSKRIRYTVSTTHAYNTHNLYNTLNKATDKLLFLDHTHRLHAQVTIYSKSFHRNYKYNSYISFQLSEIIFCVEVLAVYTINIKQVNKLEQVVTPQ